MKKITIAVDGPAAAGKSTVTKIVAQQLNYIYVDTGALYRAITYFLLQNKINLTDEEVASNLSDLKIQLIPTDNGLEVFINQQNVTNIIRQPLVTEHVSQVASLASVRQFLLQTQRDMAQQGGVIMDGRDIGTTVLPNAELKLYMTASSEARAKRRFLQNEQQNIHVPLLQLQQEIEARDLADMSRDISPLQQAPDAIVIDSTNLTQQQVVDKILQLVAEKVK